MKKLLSTWLLLALAVIGFQANAAMWLVGDAFNGWNESGNVAMTQDGTIYKYTATLTAGKYFAFFKDSQAWSSQRGPTQNDANPTGDWEATTSGGAWKVATTGTYEIQYNTTNDQAKIALQQTVAFDATKRKFAVTGAAVGGWNMPPNASQVFTNNGDGTYTWEGTVTAGEFKFSGVGADDTFDTGWSVFNGGAMGKSGLVEGDNALSTSFGEGNMTMPVSGDVTLTVSKVTETTCNLNIKLKKEVVPDPAWYIAGSFTDPAWGDGKQKLTANANGTFSITIKGLKADDEFKFVDEYEKWYGGVSDDGESYGVHKDWCTDIPLSTDGQNFKLGGNGDLTFTISADKKLSITGWEEAVKEEALYIAGSFTDWENGKVAMTKGEDAYTYTIKGAKEGDEFKLIDQDGTWYGGEAEGDNFWFNNDVTETALSTTGKNFYFDGTGDILVTVDLEKKTIKVSGFDEKVVEPTKLYVLGDFQEWKPNKGAEMTAVEGKEDVFTYVLKGEGNFKFSTKLSETEEWTIDEYLYGAESEGDFEMLEEYLGKELTLKAKGEAFKVPEGEWTLTADLKNGKLVIDGTWPVKEEALYIAGSFTEWEEGKVAMTKGEDAYTYTIKGAKEGDEFKLIDQDGTWYGGEAEGDNFWFNNDVTETALSTTGKNFYLDGTGDILVTVDLEKKTIKVSGFDEKVVEPTKLYVLGDFQEWKANAGQELAYDEATKLYGGKVTLEKEGYIKFATKLQETEEWGDLDEYTVGAVSEGNFVMQEEYLGHKIDIVAKGQAIQLPAGEWTLSVDLANDSLVITGTWPVKEEALYIAGSFTDWEEGKVAMTKGEDAYTYTIKGAKEGDEFKLIDQDGTWYGGEADGDNFWFNNDVTETALSTTGKNFYLDGTGDILVTVDLEKKTIKVSGFDEKVVEPTKLYVLGDFQNWKPNAGQELAYDEETKLYGGKVTLEEEGYIKFATKLQETEEWGDLDEYTVGAVSEGDFVMLEEYLGHKIDIVAKGQAIKLPAGEWTLSVDLANDSLVITGTWPGEEEVDLYLAGSFTNWQEGNLKMDKGEDGKYTITAEITLPEDGNAEFKFVDSKGNWYGGVSEGHFLITQEQIDEATPLSITNPGENFEMPFAGKWTLTVDLEAMNLVIAKAKAEGLKGDVDGNGIVNGADVVALYNYILNGEPVKGDPNVDGDADGLVNGQDVVALYNILLQLED